MRNITEEESLAILKPIVEREDFIEFSNHMPFKKRFGENTFKFTINILSLDVLISIMEHPQVHNVYFAATAPGPGKSISTISMNYKIYVKYHAIED